jgi:hypothetical protein
MTLPFSSGWWSASSRRWENFVRSSSSELPRRKCTSRSWSWRVKTLFVRRFEVESRQRLHRIEGDPSADDQFPDIVVTMTDGTEVDFELGEWLDWVQMGAAKRYERLEKAMLDAIAPPGPNPSPHFRAVMLTPREDATRFDPADRAAFRSEF